MSELDLNKRVQKCDRHTCINYFNDEDAHMSDKQAYCSIFCLEMETKGEYSGNSQEEPIGESKS